MSMHVYRNGKYDGFGASDEIIAAIEQVGGDDILDEESDAHRIWAEPTSDEEAEVKRIAWELASDDETELHWGGKLTRPS